MTLRRYIQLFLIVMLIGLMSMPTTPTRAAVTISSFEAQSMVGHIVVTWTTASEVNNVGFNLWRDTSVSFPMPTHLNNGQLIPSQCVGCIAGTDYIFTDTENVTAGQLYWYKLESVDVNGATEAFGPVSAITGSPSVAPTLPPTHTPVPSDTPTPTDTLTPTPTGTGGSTATATATRPTSTATPTHTPEPGMTATAVQSARTATPNATATSAPPLAPASPTATRSIEPGRTSTASASTAVATVVTQGPTATRSATAQARPSAAATAGKPASGGITSAATPIRPASTSSPSAESPEANLGRILIGVGLVGLGALLSLGVLAVAGYLWWRRSSAS